LSREIFLIKILIELWGIVRVIDPGKGRRREKIFKAGAALPSITAGTNGPEVAADKIIVPDGGAAGGAGIGHIDERITPVSRAGVRIGAGSHQQGRQYHQNQAYSHVIFLWGWTTGPAILVPTGPQPRLVQIPRPGLPPDFANSQL
jgi:hypothetical protein